MTMDYTLKPDEKLVSHCRTVLLNGSIIEVIHVAGTDCTEADTAALARIADLLEKSQSLPEEIAREEFSDANNDVPLPEELVDGTFEENKEEMTATKTLIDTQMMFSGHTTVVTDDGIILQRTSFVGPQPT